MFGATAVTKSGEIYVLDNYDDRIARYSSWTDPTPSYKTLPERTWEDTSVTSDGTIYMLSPARITRFD